MSVFNYEPSFSGVLLHLFDEGNERDPCLAKVDSSSKELDIAIVKATNHVERPAKEKHIRALFAAVSATRPRADIVYCIHALAKRLSKTRNWAAWDQAWGKTLDGEEPSYASTMAPEDMCQMEDASEIECSGTLNSPLSINSQGKG